MRGVNFDGPLAEMLRGQQDDEPRPLHEAQILELRELGAAYAQCPFKVGDLVTPRKNSNILFGVGEPWLVVDIREKPKPRFAEQGPGGCEWGTRPDIRTMVLGGNNRCYVAFWNESWKFEPYVPDTSATAAP